MRTLREAGANAELLGSREMAQRTGSPFYQAAIWCGGGNGLLQPAKYAKGLLDALPENVSLYEITEISSLERMSGGGIRAYSNNGDIEANQVIVCVGAFLPRVGVADRAVFPLELSASLSRPLNENEQAQLGNAAEWGVLSTRAAGATLRLTRDKRLLIRNTVEYRHRDLAGHSLAVRRATHLRGLQRRFLGSPTSICNSLDGPSKCNAIRRAALRETRARCLYRGRLQRFGCGTRHAVGTTACGNGIGRPVVVTDRSPEQCETRLGPAATVLRYRRFHASAIRSSSRGY